MDDSQGSGFVIGVLAALISGAIHGGIFVDFIICTIAALAWLTVQLWFANTPSEKETALGLCSIVEFFVVVWFGLEHFWPAAFRFLFR